MSDKYTKVLVPEKPGQPESSEDDWKVVEIEKTQQPEPLEPVSTIITYQQLEQQVASIDAKITSLTAEKEVLEAEMVQVKVVAEA